MPGPYTVTATASGANAFNGVALTVVVVTGAAATQNGATVNGLAANPGELAITPNDSNSWIYGALAQVTGNSDAAFTANAATTFSENFSDATDFIALGTCRSTAVTAAGTPVTIGASAPAQATHTALAEIVAAGTLAEDASSPAPVAAAGVLTVTTAAFSPPAGALLVAMACGHAPSGSAITMTITNTGGALTWVELSADADSLATIFVAQLPAPPASGGSPDFGLLDLLLEL